MRAVIITLLASLLLTSCSKYSDKRLEGVWLLQYVNLCINNDCFDTLEDRGTRALYDKIELRLTRERTAEGRFYNTGVLKYSVKFEYIFDEETGRISFVGPYDMQFPSFFGTNVSLEELDKDEMVYVAIEDVPNEETAYIYKRLQ